MKAVWHDTVIAASPDTVVVEGNHYFPLTSVNVALLEPQHPHQCPWKGTTRPKSAMIVARTPFGTTRSPRMRYAKSKVAWHSERE